MDYIDQGEQSVRSINVANKRCCTTQLISSVPGILELRSLSYL